MKCNFRKGDRVRKLVCGIIGVLTSLAALAQTPRNTIATEWAEPGVVIISMDSLEAGSDERARAFSQFTGNDIDLDDIIPMQLKIARIAANASGAIIVVPDPETKTRLMDDCRSFQLCDEIRTGRLRIEESAHDSVWIRDYGPQFGTDTAGETVVLDAKYYDLRQEQAKRDAQAQLNIVRMNLIMQMMKRGSSDDTTSALQSLLGKGGKERSTRSLEKSDTSDTTEASAKDSLSGSDSEKQLTDQEKAALMSQLRSAVGNAAEDETTADAMNKQLALLSDLADVFDRLDISRAKDDASPASIAVAALSKPYFHVERTQLYLDGGNLLRTSLGDCLTTKTLIGRNHGVEEQLTATLKTTYGCNKVIYLQQLPGPVIEHVDMFALPGPGNRVLLASYDPAGELISAAWRETPDMLRRLSVEAAVAMKRNERTLRQEGYEVISVPSPLPSLEGEAIYYPTVLNALTFKGSDESLNVLVPTYEGAPSEIQKHALELISTTFGPGAHIIPIEATVAAARQGAVHCLTIVVPLRLTEFADQAQANLRSVILAAADNLEKEVAQAAEHKLEGVWHVEQMEGQDVDVHDDERFVFKESEFLHKRGLDSDSYHFLAVSKTPKKWTLLVVGGPRDETDVSEGSIDWLDPNHLTLVYGSNHKSRRLVRN